MNKETLLAELDRLLDLGEPLLTVFPKRFTKGWSPQLPANISNEMRRYANGVAFRALNSKQYRDFLPHHTTANLSELVKEYKAGLLGWRAIGVLK